MTDLKIIEEAFPLQGDFAQDAKYTWPSRWEAVKNDLAHVPEEKSTKPTEAEIDAAIKRACGKYRVLDSYTYEDVHAVVEAVFSPPRTSCSAAEDKP